MRLDEALEGRIARILERLRARWPQRRRGRDPGRQPQAGDGARGRRGARAGRTAPGLVVPRRRRSWSWCSRARRASCSRCGRRRPGPRACAPCSRARRCSSSASCGCSGRRSPRSRARCATRRRTACRWTGWRSRPACGAGRSRSRRSSRRTPRPTTRRSRRRWRSATAHAVFARRGETIDELVAGALLGPPARTVATAESCTGGLMAARLTDRAGSSAYALGGITAYSNEAKVALAGVPEALIAAHGAVSPEVASRAGRRARSSASGPTSGIGITGIAGPGGGTPEKPVGTVCVCLAVAGGERIERTLQLPGGAGHGARADDHRGDAPAAAAARWLTSCGCSSRWSCRRRPAWRSRRSATPPTRPCGAPCPTSRCTSRWRSWAGGPPQDVEAVAALLPACAGAAGAAGARRAAAAASEARAGAVRRGRRTPAASWRRSRRASSDALAGAGLYEPERRPFRAHATVARLRSGARSPRSAPDRGPESVAFAGGPLTLFRSQLGRAGAAYEPLVQVALPS